MNPTEKFLTREEAGPYRMCGRANITGQPGRTSAECRGFTIFGKLATGNLSIPEYDYLANCWATIGPRQGSSILGLTSQFGDFTVSGSKGHLDHHCGTQAKTLHGCSQGYPGRDKLSGREHSSLPFWPGALSPLGGIRRDPPFCTQGH